MFSLFRRGRDAPQPFHPRDPYPPLRQDQARFAAWAKALADVRPEAHPPAPRRPHRGMLPDVDWSNAEPAPMRRSLLRLVAGAIAMRMLPLASMGEIASRSIRQPDGERRRYTVPRDVPRFGAAVLAAQYETGTDGRAA